MSLLCILGLFAWDHSASADAFDLSYSGRLTQPDGKPLAGPVNISLKFYDIDTGGVALVTKSHTGVELSQGNFTVPMDLTEAERDLVFDGTGDVWIEVVRGSVVYPRQKFLAVPYALKVPVDGTTVVYDGQGRLRSVSGGAGDMVSSTYDSDTNNKADDADRLGGELPAFYTNAANIPETATRKWLSDTERTKLAGVEALADVTDAANVDAAGAVMNGDFSSNGLMSRTGAGAYSIVTDNSANWDTAYTDRNQWDGGATGLVAATGRTSLGLGTIATQNANAVAITGGTMTGVTLATPTFANDAISGDKVDGGTISNFASTGIDDNAASTALTITASNHVGIGQASPSARLDVAQSSYDNPTLGKFTFSPPTTVDGSYAATGVYSQVNNNVSAGITNSSYAQGLYGSARLSGPGTLSSAYGVSALAGTTTGGTGTVTDAYAFWGRVWNQGVGTITNGYGLYLGDADATNGWGVYQTSANDKNYFAGSVGINTVAPGSALDVKGTLRLSGATSGYVGFAPPAAAGSTTYTLPSAPVGGGYLTTDAGGLLTWGTPTGSSGLQWDGGATNLVPATGRSSLGLVIGTDVQAQDAGLQSLAGLTTAANQMVYTTGADTYATTGLTSFGRDLLDDASVAAQRTTLGVAIGTNVQAYDATLQSIAGVTTAADTMIYATAADTFAATTLSTQGRALIDDADASAQRTTLGLGTMATQAASAVAITGGTIAGATITTPTFSNDAISGDKVDGGIISNFTSTGIDDNAAATAMTIDATGNVGVGTTSPAYKLVVRPTADVKVAFSNSGAGASLLAMNDAESANVPLLLNALDYRININGGEKVRIDTAGNVGIGTTAPDKALVVSSLVAEPIPLRIHRQVGTNGSTVAMLYSANNASAVMKSYASTSGVIEDSTAGAESGSFAINTVNAGTSSEKVRVLANGNVGIGTTSPSAKLHVAGVAGTDGIKFPDGTLQTTASTGSGIIVKRAYASTSTSSTTSAVIPVDNTIPQNTEGTQILTVTITPTSATNRLHIEARMPFATSANAAVTGAIFQDSTANALDAAYIHGENVNTGRIMMLDHDMVAGTTSATTFKLRIGVHVGTVSTTVNGLSATPVFGGVEKASISVEEYTP